MYELTPPVGYTNAGFGTTWTINSLTVKSQKGSTVDPSEYTVVNPSVSGNGTLTFKPTTSLLDSLVTFTVVVADLGPNFCDSVVTRSIMVAPTPKTNFRKTATTVCLGETTYF